MSNLVSIKISPEDKTTVLTATGTIKTTLAKYLVALTPEEKKEIVKMSDKTLPFVEKIAEYIVTNPEFIPPFLIVEEFNNDYTAFKDLSEILHEVTQIGTNLNDTIAVTGSETYKAGLTYYNSVKQAVKSDVANAKALFEDLRKRFEAQGPRKTNNTETPVT